MPAPSSATRLLLLALPLAGAALPCQAQASRSRLEGTWIGTADRRPDAGLPVSLRLKIAGGDDSARIALTLPESRLIDLAIPSPYSDSSTVTIRGDSVALEFTPDIGLGFISGLGLPRDSERIAFHGALHRDVLVGTLRITGYRSPVTLRRMAGDPPGPAVAFSSEQDSLALHGTLILPAGRGPHPAVVFVTGSDPDTREAWQLEARALATRGVASLLYDKRGVGQSTGASHDLASWDDLAGDVRGALRYLRSRPTVIDARCIGLVGQSQGTWIIAKVAASDSGVKFLVSISGSGISAAEQETYRTGALMRADGFPPAEITRAQAFQRQKFAVARTGLGFEALDSTMKRLRADSVRWFPGYGTGAAARSLALLRLYGVLQFNYHPARDLARIRVPTLVIMGENDRVFPPDTVIARMRDALGRGGNRWMESRIIPGATHGLSGVQTAGGRAFRRAVDPRFLDALTEWVQRQAASCGTKGSAAVVSPRPSPAATPAAVTAPLAPSAASARRSSPRGTRTTP